MNINDKTDALRARLLGAASDFDKLHNSEGGWEPTAALIREAAEALAKLTAQPAASVSGVIWRIDNEASQFVDEKGMIYLRYLRDKLDSAGGAKAETHEAKAAQPVCTCPSGDGSLRWPCPSHPAEQPAEQPAGAKA